MFWFYNFHVLAYCFSLFAFAFLDFLDFNLQLFKFFLILLFQHVYYFFQTFNSIFKLRISGTHYSWCVFSAPFITLPYPILILLSCCLNYKLSHFFIICLTGTYIARWMGNIETLMFYSLFIESKFVFLKTLSPALVQRLHHDYFFSTLFVWLDTVLVLEIFIILIVSMKRCALEIEFVFWRSFLKLMLLGFFLIWNFIRILKLFFDGGEISLLKLWVVSWLKFALLV